MRNIQNVVAGRVLETYELESLSSSVKPTAYGKPDLFKQNVGENQNPACAVQTVPVHRAGT